MDKQRQECRWVVDRLTKPQLIEKIQELELESEINEPYATGMASPQTTDKEMEQAQAKREALDCMLLELYRAYHRAKVKELNDSRNMMP